MQPADGHTLNWEDDISPCLHCLHSSPSPFSLPLPLTTYVYVLLEWDTTYVYVLLEWSITILSLASNLMLVNKSNANIKIRPTISIGRRP